MSYMKTRAWSVLWSRELVEKPLGHSNAKSGVQMYKLDIEAEFFNFVFIQDDGHWLWTGTYDEEYPRFKQEYAYRWAYKHFIGPIPERYDIDHLCEQTWCVNPICLEAVTPVVNRERQAAKQRREKTHCPSGHPYFGDNLYLCHN